jgi:ribonuclease P protein component
MPQPELQRFLPAEHLRRPSDFQRVYQRRRSVSDQWIIVYGCENGLPHLRLGLSVSRKFGGAVQRNRLRRLYREAFRLTKHELPAGLDLVIIPRTKDEPTLADLKSTIAKLISQLAGKIAKENKPK